MDLGLILKLFHVLAAIWLVSGMIGRAVTYSRAASENNVHITAALLHASDFFDRRMVIPGSMAVFLLGLITAWAQGWPLFGFFRGIPSIWLLASIILYLLLLPPIPLYLIPRREARRKAVDQAVSEDRLTPELSAAIKDRGITIFRTYEFIIVIAIITLMVLKPF